MSTELTVLWFVTWVVIYTMSCVVVSLKRRLKALEHALLTDIEKAPATLSMKNVTRLLTAGRMYGSPRYVKECKKREKAFEQECECM